MLLQIHEPGHTPLPHGDETAGLAVGIDLGTTNCVVGYALGDQLVAWRDEHGKALIPSVLAFHENDCRVGQEAVDAPSDWVTLRSIKRFMGKSWDDLTDTEKNMYPLEQQGTSFVFKLGTQRLTSVDLSARLLKNLKDKMEKLLDQPIDRAVITVPAYFDDGARTATRDAARLAGLQVLRLINEPTAAALAYGLNRGAEGIYAIYDLGGGTFDMSLLKLQEGVFQVLVTGGDTHLGGDDMDWALIHFACEKLGKNSNTLSPEILHAGLLQARAAKEKLSTQPSASFNFNSQPITITQDEFNELIDPLITRTLKVCRQVLKDAHLTPCDIKGLVLVGGATRVPLVSTMITQTFGIRPLCDIDPDEVVAAGAALQAQALTNGSDTLLLDVIPLSLGLETMGGLMEKILDRNTPIPVSKAQEFTTYVDGQTALSIHVYQGERDRVSDCRSLGHFELQGIPPMVAGAARIRVTFTVDADGILSVSAREKTTGAEQAITVVPTHGLSHEDMVQLLMDSLTHAPADAQHRQVIEAQISALRLIHSVEGALREDGNLLDANGRNIITQALNDLKSLAQSHNRDKLITATQHLESVTKPFAALRMDKHIQRGLQGVRI